MKKLLFVIESLVCAGAEKSLVNLLNTLDYSKYEVDLQMFAYGGEFESMLPEQVNVLPPLPYFSFTKNGKANDFITAIKFWHGRIKYSVSLRLGSFSNPQKAVLFWKATHLCFQQAQKQYDVAIAYAQGTPTFYVADCINARKKMAWVNASYRPNGRFRDFVSKKYDCFEYVVCVSDSAQEIFNDTFHEHKQKSRVVMDINSMETMSKMVNLPSEAKEKMSFNGIKLLTVGRFAPQKGYDIALEACKILKSRNVSFRWYALGRGEQKTEITKYLKTNKIEEDFILLGTTPNPYPYYDEADIYVQTSKHEGFGLAIAEARMLNKPVITTRFDAVFAQMVDGENGLVVDMNAEAVADGIQKLIEDKELYEHIVEYQRHEKKGNVEEIEKIYSLFEG